MYVFALGSKFPTIPYFSMIRSLLWDTITANLAFEIVGHSLQGDGNLQLSLPSGEIEYLLQTRHVNRARAPE